MSPRRRPGASFWPWLIVTAGSILALAIVASKTPDTSGLLDLRIYRDATADLFDGTLYDFEDPRFGLGFTYPPFAGLLLWSAHLVPTRVLEYAWTLGGVLGWLVVLRIVWRRGVQPHAPLWARHHEGLCVATVWFTSLLSAPGWIALQQGQLGFFLWTVLSIDVLRTLDGRRGAGLLTGLAGAVKLLPLAAVPLYAFANRTRAAACAAASFVLATVVATLLLPAESNRYWTDLVWSSRVGDPADGRNSSLAGSITRVLGDGGASLAVSIVVGAIIAAVGVLAFRHAVRLAAPITAIVVLGCVMSLLSPVTWSHHLVFLALLFYYPVLSWARWPRASMAALAALTVLLVDPISFGQADQPLWSVLRVLTMIGVLGLYARLIGLERPERPEGPRDVRPSGRSAAGGSSLARR